LISKLPRLYNFFNHIVSKYRHRGMGERHAVALAYRDLLRVLIGNMWLVWTYIAYNRGVVREIDVPIHILAHEENMIDPIDTILPENRQKFEDEVDIKLRDITWRWLIDVYQDKTKRETNKNLLKTSS